MSKFELLTEEKQSEICVADIILRLTSSKGTGETAYNGVPAYSHDPQGMMENMDWYRLWNYSSMKELLSIDLVILRRHGHWHSAKTRSSSRPFAHITMVDSPTCGASGSLT